MWFNSMRATGQPTWYLQVVSHDTPDPNVLPTEDRRQIIGTGMLEHASLSTMVEARLREQGKKIAWVAPGKAKKRAPPKKLPDHELSAEQMRARLKRQHESAARKARIAAQKAALAASEEAVAERAEKAAKKRQRDAEAKAENDARKKRARKHRYGVPPNGPTPPPSPELAPPQDWISAEERAARVAEAERRAAEEAAAAAGSGNG